MLFRSVELLGVFTDNHVLNGKALKFPIGIYNYSSECEFGLIIDKIIVNGWDTQIRVPMFQRISTKGKKQETLTVYYTDAGINNMEEIESIIFKVHAYDQDYEKYEMEPAKLIINWGNE